ncbi:phage portal protein [Methylibium sp.]|uniref:phage portal protein n=1 Tax=Methylibium sp. TaxID=2067992 RepID=UPI003D0A24FE
MRQNFIDRVIAAVDPVRAAQRMKARGQLAAGESIAAMMSATSGTSTAESDARGWNRWWSPSIRDASADSLRGLATDRARSRQLTRTNPIAASAINTNAVRAVGTGLALSAQPHRATLGWTEEQARTWRQHVHAEFSLWADSPDSDLHGVQNFYDDQDLVLRSMLESGDCFTMLPDGERTPTMPYALRRQVLEADRVGNPNGGADTAEVSAGVRFNPNGRLDGYHVYRRHPGSIVSPGGGRFVGDWVSAVGASGRRRILHHFKMLRPEQRRGLVYLGPVMQLFKDLGTYTDAEVKAAVVSAFLTVFIETAAGVGPAPVHGLTETQAREGDIPMGPGMVVGLEPGEKANAVNPGRPNPAFGPFVDVVIDQLGAGTFIGREMLMKKYNTSYVAARAAFLDAWKHLLDLRTRMVRTYCQPIYETWMAEAVILGRVHAPGFFADPRLRWAYTRSTWTGDSQGSINPKDEVAAFRDAIDAKLVTRERAEWELFGTDWSETYDTKKAEHVRLKGDDMLPAPKAGAAAPPQPTERQPAQQETTT